MTHLSNLDLTKMSDRLALVAGKATLISLACVALGEMGEADSDSFAVLGAQADEIKQELLILSRWVQDETPVLAPGPEGDGHKVVLINGADS